MLNKLWSFLDGKKSYLGLAGVFVYWGLAGFDYELPWLLDASQWVLGVGAVHKLDKLKK